MFYPTVQHRKRIAFRAAPVSSDVQDTLSDRFPQTASLLGLDYGRLLNRSAMSSDPFYALHDLFRFAAASENQLLNLMDSYVGSIEDCSLFHDEHALLESLRYHRSILGVHLERLSETLETIQLRGRPHWPRIAKDHDQFSRVEASADWLLRDYKHLHKRALAISQRCDRSMSVIMNDMNLAESKRAIAQGEDIWRLTVTTLMFTPLSFTSSFFGMNVQELGTGATPIWLWVATSCLVLMLTLMLYFLEGLVETFRLIRNFLRIRFKQAIRDDTMV